MMGGGGQFHQKDFWEKKNLAADPHYREKLEKSLALIPEGTRSIADIGCGDGSITNNMSRNNFVVGLDRSIAALDGVLRPKVCGNSTQIPYKTGSFDLVFVSQILEHLSTSELREMAREIYRVSRKHILISVPFREPLYAKIMRCPRCNNRFHPWGHIQSFSMEKLISLFPGCSLLAGNHCGALNAVPNYFLHMARLYLGRKWYFEEKDHAVCPSCGNKHFSRKDRTPMARLCDFLEREVKLLGRKTRDPYWVLALFERKKQ